MIKIIALILICLISICLCNADANREKETAILQDSVKIMENG